MDTPARIGRRIRELREEAGLSQQALAAKAGLNRVFFGALERGEHASSVDTLERVANALKIGLAELLVSAPTRTNPGPVERLLGRVRQLASDASPDELDRFERIAREFFRVGSAKATRRPRRR